MIRQRVSLAVAGAVVATTAVTAGMATSASAAPTIYDPTFVPAAFSGSTGDLSGAGSDTSEIVLDYLTKGHDGIDGFNAGKTTGRIASFAAGSDPATVQLKGGAAITRPNGSGAGKTLLYGSANNPELDFARSSSTLSEAEVTGGLQQAAFAVDGLRMAVSAAGTNAPAVITGANLVKIYDGTYTKWSDIPGYSGPGGSATIVPLIPQAGSGTRSFFEAQLKAANGGTAVITSVKSTQEHSDADIKGNPNAIAPFSTARAKGSTTVKTLDATGSFFAQRAIYNVVRQSDRAAVGTKSSLIASAFGSSGFLCSTAAKPLIEAAGFDQLATSANDGVCGTFGTAPVTNLKTNAPAKQSATLLTATAQNDKTVKLSASVSAAGELPGGSVTFSEVTGDTTKQLGKATVISGTATLTTPASTAGAHSYRAVFTPTSPASYVASTSDVTSATVLKTSAVSAGAVSTIYGQAASVSVSVTADGAAAAGGTVTVNAGGAVSTVAVSGGRATAPVPASVGAGSYTVTVSYSGDASTSASSTSTSLSVAKASSRTALKLAKKVKASKKAKATVTVKAPGAVNGKVTLKVGSKTVGTGTVKNGKAKITLKKLKKGSYKIKAVFGGSSNVNGSTSKTIKLKVTK